MPIRKPAVSCEVAAKFDETIEALAPFGRYAQNLYSALWVEMLWRIANGKILNPRGIVRDHDRIQHTIYEFNENGLQGFYSCSASRCVLISAEPSEQFFEFVTVANQARIA